MKVYLKQGLVPFVYMLFVSIISLGILSISDNLVWLKAILCVLNLVLYSTVMIGVCYKEGQQALKARFANDLERKQIIKTGEDRPLKIHEEYKWWKGLLIGGIACVPMLILLLLHTILILINPTLTGFGVATSFIYMAVFAFFMLKGGDPKDTKPMEAGMFYFNLLAIPFLMLVCAIGYNAGARKIQRQHDMINQKHREIYGEDI